MSFFTDSSLCFIPSGVKNGKAYSIVPTDGTGDLTFSRASNATRVNSSGLVEKVRTNVFNNSNTFNAAGWTSEQLTPSSGFAGYDGTNNAWKLTEDSSTSTHRLRQTPVLSGLATISVYAKANTRDWVYLRGVQSGIAQFAWFDLANGVVGTVQGSGSSTITSVGSGWYRCTLTIPNFQNGFEIYIGLTNADAVTTYAGDGTSSIYIQDAQAETGDIATDYIATTSAAVSVGPVSGLPRLDYSGGASCPSLLLEPQRTNYATFNEAFSNWSPSAGTITSNATTSPDGYANADLYTEDTTTGYHRFANSCAGATGSTKTYSLYAKWAGGTGRKWLTIDNGPVSYFDLENGVKGNVGANCTTSMQAIGNGWYRCVVTNTASSVGTFYIGTASANGGAGNHLGNGQPAIYVWGAQCEDNASYATSVIPTLSSAVTRVADSAYKTGISSLIGQTEGTVFVEYNQNLIGQSATRRIFALNDGTTSNRITAYISSSNGIDFYVRNSGGDLFLGSAASPIGNTKGVHKIAAAYKNGDYAVYLDGSLIISGAGTAGTIPACSRFDLGNQIGANSLYEPMMQALLFKTRLSNADLATLTTL